MNTNTLCKNAGDPENPGKKNLSLAVGSDEINYMVYRYLQESGYVHAAFTFRQEALLDRYKVDSSQIPPGILLSFVQRGIDFLTLEEKVLHKSSDYLRDTSAPNGKRSLLDFHRYLSDPAEHDLKLKQSEDVQMMDSNAGEASTNAAEPKPKPKPTPYEPDENVLRLHGHKLRVSDCQWNPNGSLLASCSYDNSVRIWDIPENFREKQMAGHNVIPQNRKISHEILERTATKTLLTNSLEVTAIGWNDDGGILATGCDDGIIRLWGKNGKIKALVQNHSDSVTVLKWNGSGKYFVTGSLDMTAAVCNNETAKCHKRIRHEHAVSDLDWKDDDIFASSSADGKIRVCSVSGDFQTQTLIGHEAAINCVKYSPNKMHLASGCDDKTVKIWNAQSYRTRCTLKGHQKEVYAVDWAPDTTKSALVSGSFDSTIKLWDIEQCKYVLTMLHELTKIYSVKYSPDGKHIASGADNGSVIIWDVETGLVVKTITGEGAVYGINWNRTGEQLAVSRESGALCVIDIRQWMVL